MDKKILDVYSDYLINSFSYITVIGLSAALDGHLTHKMNHFALRSKLYMGAFQQALKGLAKLREESDSAKHQ